MCGAQHLAGYGVNVVVVLNAVGVKFQFKNRGAVVMVKIPVVEYRVGRIDVRLGQRDLLRLFQRNVGRGRAVLGIGGVVIVVVDGDDAGGELQSLDRILGADAHLFQEIVAGEHRAGLQLEDDVLFISVNILDKIAGFADFKDQIL